jgi:phosphatidylglycerophosphatase C
MTPRRIAIYDLDQTLTRHATYTPFLAFAARRLHWWRLILLPVWIVMMLGHKAGLYGRAPLKQAGLRMLVGRVDDPRLPAVIDSFADRVVASMPKAARARWDADGDGDSKRVIATAALELYAQAIAAKLAADHLIATPTDANGRLIEGNCYGDAKYARVLTWFAGTGHARADCHISMYSDHPSDAPLFDWADQAVVITGKSSRAVIAQARGWSVADWRDGAITPP